ncbi:LuxR C-terminal-related transcriptional regulator [Dehalococcoidia bacterium]|nr:LuxR C-terminal-related transcriptional regulator [Dehalococcoidia bacterium]
MARDYLTSRQNAILHLIAEGKSNSEIAEVLHLEGKTVKNHIRRIYARLNISSRYEAIKLKLRVEGDING